MDLIKKIADRMTDGNDTCWAMNIESFDWVPGVGLYGIFNAYKKTGDKKYFDFLTGWAKRHLNEAYNKITVNSAAPMLTIAEMYNITKNDEYYKVCTDLAEYIVREAPRTTDGGLEHTVTEHVEAFSQQMWADTLFMACLFLVKFGIYADKREYVDFAAEQLKIHLKFLADTETGLYFHGYSCIYKNHLSGILWGRAHAWIIYSATEIMKCAGDFEDIEYVKTAVKNHIRALKNVQRSSGAFTTILNDSQSYEEISATAGIAAGIKNAVELGITDEEEMYIKAAAAVKAAVNNNGEVEKVSTGTPIMPDADAYKNIPIEVTLYGQGLAVLAL